MQVLLGGVLQTFTSGLPSRMNQLSPWDGEMHLDRELGYDFKGPKINITFYVYEISLLPEISQVNGTKAIFRFYRTDEIDIEGFNHQNQFNDLLVESFFSERLKSDRFRIQFAGFGANVSFSCSDIEIKSVESYTPTDYFKKDKNAEP